MAHEGDSDSAGVRATNDDATISKLSAVRAGYLLDPFIELFISSAQRRLPMINRGYYARIRGLEAALGAFLEQNTDCQVLSLGAGFDTMFWRLKAESRSPRMIVEVDFPEVITRKLEVVRANDCLVGALHSPKFIGKSRVLSDDYCALGVDVRNLALFEQALKESGICFSRPTFVLAECMLVYLESEASERLITWIAHTFERAAIALYEQVNPSSAFGAMMCTNLEKRGCPLLGIVESVEAQRIRLMRCGFEFADALDMNVIWERIEAKERARVQKLEYLDEFEEHMMMQSHYCIAWGTNQGPALSLDQI